MYQAPLLRQEIRVFVRQQEQHVLLAEFFSASCLPKVGETLNIELFKENPEHPSIVRILEIREHFDIESSQTKPYVVFSVTAEPVL